jgi:hypothetical protein
LVHGGSNGMARRHAHRIAEPGYRSTVIAMQRNGSGGTGEQIGEGLTSRHPAI